MELKNYNKVIKELKSYKINKIKGKNNKFRV